MNYSLAFSAPLSASTAHSGHVRALGLPGSFTHERTVLTEQGRRVYSQIRNAAPACVRPFSASSARNRVRLSGRFMDCIFPNNHLDFTRCRNLHQAAELDVNRLNSRADGHIFVAGQRDPGKQRQQ